MSYFVYNGYQHESGEVNLTRMNITYTPSSRGLRMERTDTLYLEGEIMASGAAAVLTRAQEIINTYNNDYGNARLYLDDGTATTHGLENDSPFNITGVHVMDRSWPKGGAEELANMRTFKITLQATYADNESQLIQWEETLEFQGTGGPRIEVIETYFGPIAYTQALATAQRIVQSGHAIGYTAYVTPPGPIFPEVEHVDRRVIRLGSAKQRGRIATFYPSSWQYYFTTAVPLSGVPWTR